MQITGVSGTGTSSVIEELARRGLNASATDTDESSKGTRRASPGGGMPERDWGSTGTAYKPCSAS